MATKEIGIGIVGFGTVGAGVVETLQRNGALLAERTGVRLALRGIADLDLERDRGVTVDRALLTTDAAGLIAREDVQVVVELIGGTGVARTLTQDALQAGKAVVTANKALLAEHGAELYAVAQAHHADWLFEASVGGGIPIIRALREGLVANRIHRICGILNGTCNYILTRMEREQAPFDTVLQAAQAAGYAEAEPSLDIDGWDTAHKAVILATHAFGRLVRMEDVRVEGIRDIDPMDIELAAGLGYRIKLLAVIQRGPEGLDVRVHPALIPHDHVLAEIGGVFNAVLVDGDVVGQTLYYGRGAGREPTASAVVADIVDAARNQASGEPGRIPAFVALNGEIPLQPPASVQTRYYLRLSLRDIPGMFGRVAEILGRHAISIASVMQKEQQTGEYVPVIMLTHAAPEGAFQAALTEIDALHETGAPTIRYRVEDHA